MYFPFYEKITNSGGNFHHGFGEVHKSDGQLQRVFDG